ncbi:hypothetical protein [Gordonibacter sp.]|uniref:hypothetical protein n=1 Tax=Gordonibacter sp. TaxID=1968902 RepID=UPI002FC97B81
MEMTENRAEMAEELGYDISVLEDAINDMIPGLTNYVQDINLQSEIAQMYQPGQILREKAFVEASSRVMGMATSHRFSILSNHMADFSAFEHGTNWGLHVAGTESHFLILDVFTYQEKTQITLLHLLNDERWRLFANASFDMPGLTVEDIRARFEAKCNAAVIPELDTDTWRERCDFPIGISPEGSFWPLEA